MNDSSKQYSKKMKKKFIVEKNVDTVFNKEKKKKYLILSERKVVGSANSIKEFHDIIQKKVQKEINGEKINFMSNIDIEFLKENSMYKPSEYLIVNDQKIFHVKKTETSTTSFYLFTSKTYSIERIQSWTLIEQ